MKNKFTIVYEDKDKTFGLKLLHCTDNELSIAVSKLNAQKLYILGVFEGFPINDIASRTKDDWDY